MSERSLHTQPILETLAVVKRRPSPMLALVEREDTLALELITVLADSDPQPRVGSVLALTLGPSAQVLAWRLTRRPLLVS
jgi:hypothetical protein